MIKLIEYKLWASFNGIKSVTYCFSTNQLNIWSFELGGKEVVIMN